MQDNTTKQLLPNLKKDRIQLQLINRTNEDSTINLFELPKGINVSEDIGYGDLVLTKYCEVTIPKTEFSTAKEWEWYWVDEDGVEQASDTTGIGISYLVSAINLSSNELFMWREEGDNYIIYKQPISTFLNWTPDTNPYSAGTLVRQAECNSGLTGSMVAILNGTSKYWGGTVKGYWGVNSLYDGVIGLEFYNFIDSTPVKTIDTLGVYDLKIKSVIYDSENEYIWVSGLNQTSGKYQVLVFDLDFDNTLIKTFNLGSPYAGYLFYSPTNKVVVELTRDGVALTDATMNIYDVQTMTAIYGGYLNYSAVNVTPTSVNQGAVEDDNGNIWVMSGDASSVGIYKLNPNDWENASDEIQPQSFASATSRTGFTYANGYFYTSVRGGFLEKISDLGVSSLYLTIRSETSGLMYNSNLGDYIYVANRYGYNIYDLNLNLVYSTNLDVDYSFLTELYYDSSNGYMIGCTFGGVYNNFTIPYSVRNTNTDSYTDNDFTEITTGINTYYFNSYEVVEGTGIQVTDIIGGLSYIELINELRNNIAPYYFKYMSIYADTLNQANEIIIKETREVNGYKFKNFDYPTVSPVQKKYALLNIPLNFSIKSISRLQYTVKAGESVTIILNYTKGNLNSIVNVVDEYLKSGKTLSESILKFADKLNTYEKEYIETTVKDIWYQRKKEYKNIGIDINIDDILLNTKEVKPILFKNKTYNKLTDIIKEKNIENQSNNIKKLVDKYIKEEELDNSPKSESNIRNIVSKYLKSER